MFPYPFSFLATAESGLAQLDNDFYMEFDGVDDYVDCGAVTALNSTSACTISCWGKLTAASGDDITVGSYIGATNGVWIQWYSGNTYVYFVPRNGVSNSIYVPLTLDTDWHHFVGVYDGTNASIYVDGALGATTTVAVPASLSATAGNNFQIGTLDGAWLTSGNIDEVAIWNVALDVNDIEDIYNATDFVTDKCADLSSMSTPPVAWYRMGD